VPQEPITGQRSFFTTNSQQNY